MNTLELIATSTPMGKDIYLNTLELIRGFQAAYQGNSPSMREIARMIDLQEGKPPETTSVNTVEERIKRLEFRNLIFRPKSEISGKRDVPRIILSDQAEQVIFTGKFLEVNASDLTLSSDGDTLVIVTMNASDIEKRYVPGDQVEVVLRRARVNHHENSPGIHPEEHPT